MNIKGYLKRFFVSDSYKLRHDILEILGKKWNVKKNQSQSDFFIKEKEILILFSKYEPTFVKSNLTILKEKNEVSDHCDKESELSYLSTKKGLEEYLNEKYINEGSAKGFSFISDYLKNFVAIIVLASFVRTVFLEDQNSKSVESIKNEIQLVKQELESLKTYQNYLQKNQELTPQNQRNTTIDSTLKKTRGIQKGRLTKQISIN